MIPIYVITMPNFYKGIGSKRRGVLEEHFKDLDLDVTWFNGINNHKFGLSTRVPWEIDYIDRDFDPSEKFDYETRVRTMQGGHIGCNLSHYMLWKTLTFLDHDRVIVFEDDVEVYPNFWENLKEIEQYLPDDWDFVYLGYNHKDVPFHHKLKYRLNDRIIQIPDPHMTHSYMIKKETLPILLDRMHIAWQNVDLQLLKRVLPHINHYVCEPPLATQRSVNSVYSSYFNRLTEFTSIT